MEDKYVLVLGSKPDSKLPDIRVEKIYSANGAAERALTYKKKYPNIYHTALIGAKEFQENSEVSKRVIISKPDELLIRMGNIDIPDELKSTKKIYNTNQYEQFIFQSKFYKFGRFDLIFGETFFYETNIIKILKHFKMCATYRGFLGASTGFYSILLALYENPNCNVIVSGIGLVEGGHYYTSNNTYGFISKTTKKLIENDKNYKLNKFRNTSRCRVERYLINRIKNKYKKRIVSTDNTMVYHGKLKIWDKTF